MMQLQQRKPVCFLLQLQLILLLLGCACSFPITTRITKRAATTIVLSARRSRAKQSFNPRTMESFRSKRPDPNPGSPLPLSVTSVTKATSKQTTKATTKVTTKVTSTLTNNTIPTSTTLGGGADLIFAMARRMILFQSSDTLSSSSLSSTMAPPPLPRWHPHGGISNDNPQFRTKTPTMDHNGYASMIWRNVRKRNAPSLWRHALRTYTHMTVPQRAIHHHGAILACAKLGLWQTALELYETAEQQFPNDQKNSLLPKQPRKSTSSSLSSSSSSSSSSNPTILLATAIQACVSAKTPESLHAGKELLLQYTSRYTIPTYCWNSLQAAHLSLGLDVFDTRIPMDAPSHALVVQVAIAQQDWTQAVQALETMTESGYYPTTRQWHAWNDHMER
jgi:hypothetical protein